MLARFVRSALLALLLPVAGTAQDDEVGCVTCHGAEAKLHRTGVHAAVGVSCVDCHGGNPSTLDGEIAHGDALRPLTDVRAGVESCGGCHSDAEAMRGTGLRTDQLAHFWTSPHGLALAESDDSNVATCVSCHGDHAIFRSTDPRSSAHKFRQAETCGRCHADAEMMESYDLDASVVDQYRHSVHGIALLEENRLSSPSCSDCHGSHSATPPRVAVLGRVCGNCHSVVQRFFEESPHLAVVREGRMEECVSCHGSHGVEQPTSDLFVGAGKGSCSDCHVEGSEPMGVAAELESSLVALDESIADAERRLQEAGRRGLFLAEEHGYLDDARSLRGRARSRTHALSSESMTDVLNRGQAVVDQTYESLSVKERAFRDRKIFTATLLLVNLLLAFVLQTYRREVYGRRRNKVGA